MINMVLMRNLWNFGFFGRGDVSPSHSELCLSLCFGVIGKTPGLISHNNFVYKNFVCIDHCDNVLARCDSIFPLFSCQRVLNKMFTQLSLSQILFQNPKTYSLGNVQRFCYHFYAIRRVCFLPKSTTAAMFTSVPVDFGRPPLSSSSTAPFRLEVEHTI